MTPISVVIVTYNSAEHIEACIERIAGPKVKTIVVDNSSVDETGEILNRLSLLGLIDEVHINSENAGFARAVNIALRNYVDAGSDVLLLNPDALIGRNDLDLLANILASDPTLGIVAPIVDSGPAVRVISAGEQPTFWPMAIHYSGLGSAAPKIFGSRSRHLYMKAHGAVDSFVGWTSGCCMLIRSEVLDSVGLLNERWFMYAEDVEYCRRTQSAGYRILLTANVRAEHAVGASVATTLPQKDSSAGSDVATMWSRNLTDYYKSEFEPSPVVFFLWRCVFSGGLASRAVIRLAVNGLRNRRNEVREAAIRHLRFARAVWHRPADSRTP